DAEIGARAEGEITRGDAHDAEPPQTIERLIRLLADRNEAREVEGDVHTATLVGFLELLLEVLVVGIERHVRTGRECARACFLEGIDGDDGGCTDHAQQLDSVVAKATQTPHRDALSWPGLRGIGDGSP